MLIITVFTGNFSSRYTVRKHQSENREKKLDADEVLVGQGKIQSHPRKKNTQVNDREK